LYDFNCGVIPTLYKYIYILALTILKNDHMIDRNMSLVVR